MSEERLSFQAEVSRLLDIVAHSLYSEKEVFLRELISNASDACDRLRYAALTDPSLSAEDPNFRIRLTVDPEARTLTVADNGIGMNRDDLVENLGTIARSGTAAFVGNLSGDDRKDVSLIGQFGVGFYSAFMVADRVEVLSRKAGETHGWRWVSDGKGDFTISAVEGDAGNVERGTAIILHLREDAAEYLEEARLRAVVRKYSDHIAVPVLLGAGSDAPSLNSASALWMRPRNEITQEQYTEFYHHVGHAADEPWFAMHWRAEGKIEYTALLYIPSSPPFDLFDPQRRNRVKLYVRRVFITEEAEELLPGYLRFLRGVVDSEDLPLNVSREMLQHNPVLARIRSGLVRRVLNDLTRKANDDAEGYANFWGNFGAVLKEGLYEDHEHRGEILKLARFASTGENIGTEAPTSLADYVQRMKPGQEAIYTITGDDAAALARSPQLEGFKARGIEVLLLTDPVDDFWLQSVSEFDGKPFRSVTRGGVDLDKIAPAETAETAKEDRPSDAKVATLVAFLKSTLGEAVKDVRVSARLTDSAVCLVAGDDELDMHLERLLKQHRRLDHMAARVLEVNPDHTLVRRLIDRLGQPDAAADLGDVAFLLLDQARIIEGEPVADPQAFARRLAAVMAKGLMAA